MFDLSQDDLDRESAAANVSNNTDLPPLPKRSTSTAFESRFPMNAGITGYVAATGESVNIRNAYEDDRFDAAVDNGCGFRHRTILAMPIKYAGAPPGGKVLGVFQLVNKVSFNHRRRQNTEGEAKSIAAGVGTYFTAHLPFSSKDDLKKKI